MTTTPLVERRWREDFIRALRVRQISGADIGDALAQVESYCLESRESADEAFGDATDYAQSLSLRPCATVSAAIPRGYLLRAAASLAGMLLVVAAVAGAVAGTRTGAGLVVTLGGVLAAGIVVAVVLRVVRHLVFGRALVVSTRSPRTVALVVLLLLVPVAAVVTGLSPLSIVLLNQELVTLPDPAALVVGLVLLVGAGVWEVASGRAPSVDSVADPRDALEGAPAPRPDPRGAAVVVWVVPVVTAAAAIFVGFLLAALT